MRPEPYFCSVGHRTENFKSLRCTRGQKRLQGCQCREEGCAKIPSRSVDNNEGSHSENSDRILREAGTEFFENLIFGMAAVTAPIFPAGLRELTAPIHEMREAGRAKAPPKD